MNWRAVKEVIDAASPAALIGMIADAGFWQSGEDVYVKAAILLREKERIDEALMLIASVLKRQTQLTPSTVAALKHLQAESFSDKRHFNEAIRVYDAILAPGEDATAYANRGLAYWELGEWESALNDYKKAVALDPNDPTVMRSIGEILNKLERYSEAVTFLHKAIDLDSASSRTFCALGIAYFNTGSWLEAYRALKKAADIEPGNKVAQLGIKKIEDHFELSDMESNTTR